MDENRCVVCGEIKREGKAVVDNPLPKHIEDLLKHAKILVENGEIRYQVLARYEEELSAKEKASLRYHRICRQGVLKSKRPSTPVGGYTTPAKRGRSTKTTSRVRMSFRSPEAAKPKEKKCVLSPHFCQRDGRDELHKVESDSRGYELMGIKERTANDMVRSALSELNEHPGKAASLELHYHRNCLVYARRT